MIHNMENFGETVLPETELSEGKEEIIQKLQKMKGEGTLILENEEYLSGARREQELLENSGGSAQLTIQELFENSGGSAQLTIIKVSKTLCRMIAKNPEKIAA